jgi:hypothetical protein
MGLIILLVVLFEIGTPSPKGGGFFFVLRPEPSSPDPVEFCLAKGKPNIRMTPAKQIESCGSTVEPLNSFNKVLTRNIWWVCIKVLSLYSKSNIMTISNKMVTRLEFSLDYDGVCEDVELFQVGDEDLTNEVEYNKIDDFVEKLLEVDGFFVSEHRTEVSIGWNGTGKMVVFFRVFNSPDNFNFSDHEIVIEPIEFTW